MASAAKNPRKTMWALLGGFLLFGFVAAVAMGGFRDASPNDGARSEAARVPGAQSNPADINTTQLPDANYATKGLLEARKQGLASESADLADSSKTGTIDPLAVDPYTAADYPDVVRRWGNLIPTVNRERKIAAQIASRDPRCDGVVNAQITDGGTRTDRHYMTECNNLTRVYFDANSLAEHRSALVRTQADMGAQGVLDW